MSFFGFLISCLHYTYYIRLIFDRNFGFVGIQWEYLVNNGVAVEEKCGTGRKEPFSLFMYWSAMERGMRVGKRLFSYETFDAVSIHS